MCIGGYWYCEIHIQKMSGDRSKLKALLFGKSVIDSKDAGGKTPLMYAVIGKQAKVRCNLVC